VGCAPAVAPARMSVLFHKRGRRPMRGSLLVIALASSVSLAACATNREAEGAATGAAVGGATGAAVGAVAPGISTIEGAVAGAAIGGLAGAVWADQNNDGRVDGYMENGVYHEGAPSGWDPTTRSVVTGAAIGGATGAV